jgi:hypothetical protein
MTKIEHVRAEMIFDYVQKMKLTEMVDPEYFR